MKPGLFLFALMLFVPQLMANACETTKLTFTGNLDSRAPIGNEPPPFSAPVEEQLAAAQVTRRVKIFDSLGHSHSAFAAFYHTGAEAPWSARLIVDDENLDTSYASPGIGDAPLLFDADGNHRTDSRFSIGASYRWHNSTGVNQQIIIVFLPDSYPEATEITLEQDGNAEGCTRRGGLDFDGDGSDDLAIWRPEFGLWAILKSSSNSDELIFKQWGLPGDYPIPGDYTGDGKADLVLYRRETAVWYICKSELNYDCAKPQIVQFGLPGDIPVKGDYDGDTINDFAVYRLSTNTFLYRSTRFGYLLERQWGLSKDIPLQAVINQRPR